MCGDPAGEGLRASRSPGHVAEAGVRRLGHLQRVVIAFFVAPEVDRSVPCARSPAFPASPRRSGAFPRDRGSAVRHGRTGRHRRSVRDRVKLSFLLLLGSRGDGATTARRCADHHWTFENAHRAAKGLTLPAAALQPPAASLATRAISAGMMASSVSSRGGVLIKLGHRCPILPPAAVPRVQPRPDRGHAAHDKAEVPTAARSFHRDVGHLALPVLAANQSLAAPCPMD